MLSPAGADLSDLELAAAIQHAAAAKEFDDRLAPMTGLLRSALRDQRLPDSILLPMQAVVPESEVAPSLRRNAVDSVALPTYPEILRVCKANSDAMQQVAALREACSTFGQKGMRSPAASLVSMMIGGVIVRRLHKGTPLEAEAKEMRRKYVWLSENVWPDSTHNEPHNAERLQQDVAQFGEWEALQRQAERAGISRTPPPGWLPANPQALLMSEERTPQAPKR